MYPFIYILSLLLIAALAVIIFLFRKTAITKQLSVSDNKTQEAPVAHASAGNEQLETEKKKLEEKNRKLFQMNETVYKKKKKVDEENQKLLLEKEKLEADKKKVDEKVKKLWSQSTAIHKEKERINEIKIEIERKHKEVTDSINYAKRIQVAILKGEEHVSKHLPEHFVLFKPRDVVSGDFYWAYEKENEWYIAAIDCTGHGVPGAFLTMLGSAFLNEICSVPDILSPGEVLNRLRDKIIKELSSQGEVKDGMDLSFCKINLATKEMQWAGANNPLWYFQNGEMKSITADKQPIGIYDLMKPFSTHTIQLAIGDTIYLFTDGYADQFGGPKEKKFKYKPLQEALINMTALSMEEQKQKLNDIFEEWKGPFEQTDDVCIIGIRL